MSDAQADYLVLRMLAEMLDKLAADTDHALTDLLADLPDGHPEDADALRVAAQYMAHEMTVRALSLYDRNEAAIERAAKRN
jgi:hypothetical protein